MDLISLVLTLRPVSQPDTEHPLPLWWGRAAHALLLNTVRAVDENLAQTLHDESSIRPLTASNLMGSFKQGKLNPEGDYTLRFTGLNQAVSQILWDAIQADGWLAPGKTVELDYIRFEVSAATCDPKQNEWTALTNYNDLAAARLVSTEAAERQTSLYFASPTQFHTHERTMPLPLPDLVFGSLADRWNSFAPIAFPPELKRYASECLVINRFDLVSRPVVIKNGGKRIGAVGQISYTTLNYDRYWMSLIQTLAAFALFAGVGAGVTMGLGQTRQV
jgi:CRISPR-associated endoribonuclease Cas6